MHPGREAMGAHQKLLFLFLCFSAFCAQEKSVEELSQEVRENLFQRNVSMAQRLQEIFKFVEKLEDEWVYKQERNLWPPADENYYRGEKNEDGQNHGLGVVALPNGDYYMGQWKYNMRHGYGKTLTGYSLSEISEEYISEWKFDEPHGVGSYKTGDGLVCEGEWVGGRQHGFAVFSWPDGSYFAGEWEQGQQHGNGIWQNANVVHEGTWDHGKRTGYAKITSKKDGRVIFREFVEDRAIQPNTQ